MKLRVSHIPQIPGKPFYVPVSSVEEGVKFMDALAAYDFFQLENNIKPDYCNFNELQMYDESLSDDDVSDMDLHDRWVSWYSEDECYEDPREYLDSLKVSAA